MRFNNSPARDAVLQIFLLLLRVFIGFAMLTHGYPKLQKLLSGEEIQFFSLFGLSQKITLILAVFAEFVCSIFIILGLFTRICSIPLILTMIIAGFVVHAPDKFADRELAFLYLAIYLLFLIIGAGKYSVDAMMKRSSGRNY